MGTASFVSDKEIEAAASTGKLKAKNLIINAARGVTLGPVEVDDVLNLNAPKGDITVEDAKAARYEIESVEGTIAFDGHFPKSDSNITNVTGKTAITMACNSGGRATLSIVGQTSTQDLQFDGFNGKFESNSKYGTTHLTTPTQTDILSGSSWDGHGEVTVGSGG